jgi:hypothetical protein
VAATPLRQEDSRLPHFFYKFRDYRNFKQRYSDKFKLIIDVFVNKIIARFEPTSYITLIELYECFILVDYNRKIDSKVQKPKNYKNILDFERLKCDAKAFVCYKVINNEVDWHMNL